MNRFIPQELSFEEGSKRIRAALHNANVDIENTIITSRDPSSLKLKEDLKMGNLPEGVQMWQLPLVLNRSLIFISVVAPNAVVPEHRHAQAPVFRLVVSGSIIYNGVELTVGDWMYVPAGKPYSFAGGASGGTVMYPHPEPWR
jgi:hypothetical protein